MRNAEARRMSELTTAAQRGDLAVRPSEPNVYAGEIDVLSVRSSVRKGQGSVRETDCKAKAVRDAGRSQGSENLRHLVGRDPRSKITIKSRKAAQMGAKKPSQRHNPGKH